MARLPQPGSDTGTWGAILNEFLTQSLNTDGTLKDVGVVAAKAEDAEVVHNAGDETIAGVKNFSSSPIVPTPTNNTQAANKTYVDSVAVAGAPDATTTNKGLVQLAGDLSGTATAPTVPALAGKATDSAVVHNTGAETVAGVKTFSSSPVVPTPTTGTQASNKTYVDTQIATAATPDATTSSKGIIQLAGDLTGTAAGPQIAAGAIIDADINASANINQNKILNLTDDIASRAYIGGDTFTGLISFGGSDHAGLQLNNLSDFDRDNLGAADGMLIYNIDTASVQVYSSNTGTWIDLTGIAIYDEFSPVLMGAISIVFTGDGVSVSDGGSNTAIVDISGGSGGGSGTRVEDEGTSIVAAATGLNFVGAGVTVTNAGSDEALITIPGSSTPLTVQDENGNVSTAVTQIDFQGAGVTATSSAGEIIVTIPGGGSGIRVEDENSSVVAAATGINFAGAGVTVTNAGSNEATVTIPGSATSLTVQDENGNVSTAVTQIDFQGAGVTANAGTGEVVVTIPGVGGTGTVALTDGVNIATNAALGNVFTVTLGGNRAIDNPSNPTDGQKIIYRLKQDATGSRTVVWGTNFRFGTDVPSPTLTTTANKTDYIGFIYNATDTKWDCLAVSRGI